MLFAASSSLDVFLLNFVLMSDRLKSRSSSSGFLLAIPCLSAPLPSHLFAKEGCICISIGCICAPLLSQSSTFSLTGCWLKMKLLLILYRISFLAFKQAFLLLFMKLVRYGSGVWFPQKALHEISLHMLMSEIVRRLTKEPKVKSVLKLKQYIQAVLSIYTWSLFVFDDHEAWTDAKDFEEGNHLHFPKDSIVRALQNY